MTLCHPLCLVAPLAAIGALCHPLCLVALTDTSCDPVPPPVPGGTRQRLLPLVSPWHPPVLEATHPVPPSAQCHSLVPSRAQSSPVPPSATHWCPVEPSPAQCRPVPVTGAQ
ncbi:hypothetical protein DV515_00019787 [Chloebia gouldiae]|uniref:Secreted protein n=1 Tax=Chloebia gouldiae TaxID=44316 RepID=A0A3L8Q3R3_CHLGU|nr:hypothetical protein DV515_00019787 [Chloebia gouldiae]